ncbi:MAG: DinB family protein [Acidobacteria bacterium]|nr:DinB family protein [Acidobacteriota bacterium]
MSRPEKGEYAEYYERYVGLVPETEIVAVLREQLTAVSDIFAAMPEAQGGFAYAPGKWTIKQLVGHLIDGERVFAYRALRFARRDPAPLEGFEQDHYVANADFDSISLADLVEELVLLRRANIIFFNNLNEEMWSRQGVASGAGVSVRALAFIMAGHIRHHLNILKERYLAQ